MSNTRKATGVEKVASIDDIIGAATLPEHTVRLCLLGELVAEHERLEADLNALPEFVASHMADTDPRVPLAQQLRDIEQQMAASETAFTFRALGSRKYRELVDAHPGKPDERFDTESFPRALISACAVDPVMTPTDVDRLFDVLNAGQVEALFMAAFVVNEGPTSVPFSASASEVLSRRAPK